MTDKQQIASNLGPLAEFHRLKEEIEGISAQMRASASLLNPLKSPSDALLGSILKELKAMRVEVKEVKEDVKKIEEKQEKLQEVVDKKHETLFKKLCENERSVNNVKKAQNQFKFQVTENQKAIKLKQQKHDKKLMKIQEDVTSNNRNLMINNSKTDKISKTTVASEEPKIDIKEQIRGKWRNIINHVDYFSAEIKGDELLIKWGKQTIHVDTLAVKRADRFTFSVQKEKIILKCTYIFGEEFRRWEFCMEDGKLVRKLFYNGILSGKSVYERVGEESD